jgi:V8-like Glu-specific endopeptidase
MHHAVYAERVARGSMHRYPAHPTSTARTPLSMLRIRLLTALLATVVLTALAPGAASAAKPNTDRAKILAHWTAERMERAIPRKGRPGGAGGDSTAGVRQAVPNPTTGLNRTNGKVFMTLGGTDYVCSGTAVQSGNDSLVWTAGHCIYEAGAYAENFLFVPAYGDGAAPFGEFTAATANLRTTPAYAAGEGFVDDFGAAVVGTAGGMTLAQAVGERPLDFNPPNLLQSYTLFGYPVNAKTGSGEIMWQCAAGSAFLDTKLGPPSPVGVPCSWPGGSSGGGWVDGTGDLVTVTSYGYGRIGRNVYGSDPRPAAQVLWTQMQGS